jgi:hypothetical protein
MIKQEKEILIPNEEIIRNKLISYSNNNKTYLLEDTALGGKSNTVWIFFKKEMLDDELKEGDIITGISFLPMSGRFLFDEEKPTHILNFKEYNIKMGNTTYNPINDSLENLENLENIDEEINKESKDYREVRTGQYSYDSKKLTTLFDFAPKLKFSEYFTYTGTNLIIKYTHSKPTKTCPSKRNKIECNREELSALGIIDSSKEVKGKAKVWFGKGFDAQKINSEWMNSKGNIFPIIKFHIK